MSEYFVMKPTSDVERKVKNEGQFVDACAKTTPYVGVIDEDDLLGAHEFLSKLPQAERSALDGLVDRHAVVYEILGSDDLPRRNDALFAVIASVFAAAPAHSTEAFDPPAWKRVLGGAARGARMTAHAVAVTTPGKIHRQPVDQDLIDSVLERRHLLERRDTTLGRLAELNARKRALLDGIDQDYESIKALEVERNQVLSDVEAKEAAFMETLMQADLSRPETHAHADVMCTHLEDLKNAAHAEFDKKYSSLVSGEEKARLLDKIDSELTRLHERGLC